MINARRHLRPLFQRAPKVEFIEDQVEVCRREIERQGWTAAKVYTDRAQSGASRFRPQYQQMIADAEQSSSMSWSARPSIVWAASSPTSPIFTTA